MTLTVLLGLAAALGAVCRYAVGRLLASTRLPYGTLVVNVVGSFSLGLVAFGGVDAETLLVVGTGFCGAFTTFSSFSFQTVELWERGDRRAAVGNALANLLCSVTAIAVAAVLVGS